MNNLQLIDSASNVHSLSASGRSLEIENANSLEDIELRCRELVQPHFSAIESYWQDHAKAETVKNLHHIRKPLRQQNVPFSFVYVPKGSMAGLHILLKKRGIDLAGKGSYNNVSYTYNIHSQRIAVMRSCLSRNLSDIEKKLNLDLMEFPEYFLTGESFEYVGPRCMPTTDGKKTLHFKCCDKTAIILPCLPLNLKQCLLNDLLSHDQKLTAAIQLCEAVAKLHVLGYAHLDLKPANLFFQNQRLVIGDFGLAVGIESQKGYAGSPIYMAPEHQACYCQDQNLPSRSIKVKASADIWSLGCILADFFEAKNPNSWHAYFHFEQQRAKFLTGIPVQSSCNRDIWMDVCLPFWENPKHPHCIIRSCLQFEAEARPDAAAIATSLKMICRQAHSL